MELSKVGAYSGFQGYWAIWGWMGFPVFSLGSCCISGKPGGSGVLSLTGGSLVSTLVSHILRSGQLAFSDNSCKQQANPDCLAPLSSLFWHLDHEKKVTVGIGASIAAQTHTVGPKASWPLCVSLWEDGRIQGTLASTYLVDPCLIHLPSPNIAYCLVHACDVVEFVLNTSKRILSCMPSCFQRWG